MRGGPAITPQGVHGCYCVVPPGAGAGGAAGVAGSLAGGAPGVAGELSCGRGVAGVPGTAEGEVGLRSSSLVLGGGTSVGLRSQPASRTRDVVAAATPSHMREVSSVFMGFS